MRAAVWSRRRLSSTPIAALQRRGVDEWAAALAGETGIAAFKVAYLRWLAPGGTWTLAELIRETLGELPTLAAKN